MTTKTIKIAYKAMKSIKRAVREDRDHLVRLDAPVTICRLQETVYGHAVPDWHGRILDVSDRVVMIVPPKPGEESCDGASYCPDKIDALGLDHDGFDAYVVASKLITQTPVPVLLSAGLLLSDEVVNGVVGHNDYDVVAFGNIDVLPAENVAIGLEYKQGVNAGDGIRNHDYWDAHVAWFVTKQLTLVAAFAETGDKDKFYRHGSAKNLGVGSGAVFSIQYQF